MVLKKLAVVALAGALIALMIPASPAYASTLTPAPAADIIVSGKGVAAPARYTLADLQALASPGSTSYIYSGLNTQNFGHVFNVEGIALSTLLSRSAPVLSNPLTGPITFVCSDATPFVFDGTAALPLLSTTLYYYPNIATGSSAGATAVAPVISWSGTDTQVSPGTMPPVDFGYQPRLVFGQATPTSVNISFFPKVVQQIVVGEADSTPVLTVNGTAYSAQDLLRMNAVTGSFTYSASSGDKTDAVMGVSLASLLSGVADTDTVTFTAWDSATYSTEGYTMTKAQLVAANAVLAYSVNSNPVQNASYGPSPTLYLDGAKPAKNIMNISTVGSGEPSVSVSVSPANATVQVGDTTTLSATVSPDSATGGVVWTSDNSEVATVSASGVVTGLKAGTAIITATSVADGSAAGSATVTVLAPSPTGGVTVKLGVSELTVKAGYTTLPVDVTVTPDSATGGVVWTSSDPGVATVAPTGAITGVSEGTAIITATSVDDPDASDTLVVTVTAGDAGGGASTATTTTAGAIPTTGDVLNIGGLFVSVLGLGFTLSFYLSSRRRRVA